MNFTGTPVTWLIESAAPALGTDDARFNEQVEALVKAIRDPGTDLAGVKTLLGNFIHAVSGGSLYRKASFLLDSLGKPVFSPLVDISERPFLP